MYLQPLNSRSCGQHTVANMINVRPEHVIKVFSKNGATRTKDLHKAFKHYGYESPDKLIKINALTELPHFCALKITWDNKRGSHWVSYIDGLILCSVHGAWSCEQYFKQSWRGKATSYLPVTEIIKSA